MNKKEETNNPQPENQAPDLEQQLIEMTDLLKRTQANFENYRKQTEKRIEEMQQMAAKNIIMQLLPVLDHFELALKSADHKLVNHDFMQGIELIYSQLLSLLETTDVTVIETIGKTYDPYNHEALMKVESEEPENTILEEFQKGYTMHGKVIRHAKVKVSAGKKGSLNDGLKGGLNDGLTKNKSEDDKNE